ncbi:MAG: biotin transporter BioY, partial [Clostridiales bacterium]|nr:biotin transporter BioY [Clostridiales bacterium]
MIPINLALLAVYLTAFVLEGRGAMLAVGLYLLLGAVGLPVFAGFKGGLHALVGNTGGYLLGY